MRDVFRFAAASTPVTIAVLLVVAAFFGFVLVRDLVRLLNRTGSISGLFPVAIVLLVLIGYVFYARQNIRFEISNAGLTISGDMLYGRSIPSSALLTSKARTVDLSTEKKYQPVYRSNGVGLPGYATGWFKLQDGEKALVFVGDRHRVVYVPTSAGYALLLSVNNPEEFVGDLRTTLGSAVSS